MPSMRTIKPLAKPEPATVSVNPGPPARTLEGERLLTLGAEVITAESKRLWGSAKDLKTDCVDWVIKAKIGAAKRIQVASVAGPEIAVILVRVRISSISGRAWSCPQ
jgi:hypothetical protein